MRGRQRSVSRQRKQHDSRRKQSLKKMRKPRKSRQWGGAITVGQAIPGTRVVYMVGDHGILSKPEFGGVTNYEGIITVHDEYLQENHVHVRWDAYVSSKGRKIYPQIWIEQVPLDILEFFTEPLDKITSKAKKDEESSRFRPSAAGGGRAGQRGAEAAARAEARRAQGGAAASRCGGRPGGAWPACGAKRSPAGAAVREPEEWPKGQSVEFVGPAYLYAMKSRELGEVVGDPPRKITIFTQPEKGKIDGNLFSSEAGDAIRVHFDDGGKVDVLVEYLTAIKKSTSVREPEPESGGEEPAESPQIGTLIPPVDWASRSASGDGVKYIGPDYSEALTTGAEIADDTEPEYGKIDGNLFQSNDGDAISVYFPNEDASRDVLVEYLTWLLPVNPARQTPVDYIGPDYSGPMNPRAEVILKKKPGWTDGEMFPSSGGYAIDVMFHEDNETRPVLMKYLAHHKEDAPAREPESGGEEPAESPQIGRHIPPVDWPRETRVKYIGPDYSEALNTGAVITGTPEYGSISGSLFQSNGGDAIRVYFYDGMDREVLVEYLTAMPTSVRGKSRASHRHAARQPEQQQRQRPHRQAPSAASAALGTFTEMVTQGPGKEDRESNKLAFTLGPEKQLKWVHVGKTAVLFPEKTGKLNGAPQIDGNDGNDIMIFFIKSRMKIRADSPEAAERFVTQVSNHWKPELESGRSDPSSDPRSGRSSDPRSGRSSGQSPRSGRSSDPRSGRSSGHRSGRRPRSGQAAKGGAGVPFSSEETPIKVTAVIETSGWETDTPVRRGVDTPRPSTVRRGLSPRRDMSTAKPAKVATTLETDGARAAGRRARNPRGAPRGSPREAPGGSPRRDPHRDPREAPRGSPRGAPRRGPRGAHGGSPLSALIAREEAEHRAVAEREVGDYGRGGPQRVRRHGTDAGQEPERRVHRPRSTLTWGEKIAASNALKPPQ